MFSNLASRMVEAYASPRVSAQRMLVAAPSLAEALLMTAAAFALLELLTRLMQMGVGVTAAEVLAVLQATSQKVALSPEDLAQRIAASKSLQTLLAGFGWHMLQTVFFAYLCWRIGSLAGGGASFRQVFAVTGWWSLASVPASTLGLFLLLVSHPALSALGVMAMFLLGLYVLYLLAAFVAEAHGFESEGSVFAAMMAAAFMMAILVMSFGRG